MPRTTSRLPEGGRSVRPGRKTLKLLLVIQATLLLGVVSDGRAATNAFVTIPPQAYFVERLGADLVDVDVLVGPGQSPHSYEPTPRQMARLSEADVYFTIGLPFETELVRRIRGIAPELLVVATDYPVPKRPIEGPHEEQGTAHGDAGGHAGEAQGLKDPHVWLDPDLVKIQADVIARTLERLDPANAEMYASNLQTFLADKHWEEGRERGRRKDSQ